MNKKSNPVPPSFEEDLDCWFGLTYASFLVLPRVMMKDMPDEWQQQMAKLLFQFDDHFGKGPPVGFRVQATTRSGKMQKMPQWLLNYRYPDKEQLSQCKYEE